MIRTLWRWIAFWSLWLGWITLSAIPDFDVNYEYNYNLREVRDSLQLRLSETVSFKYNTELSAHGMRYALVEDWFAPNTSVKFRINGHKTSTPHCWDALKEEGVFLSGIRLLRYSVPALKLKHGQYPLGSVFSVTANSVFNNLDIIPPLEITADDFNHSYLVTFQHPADCEIIVHVLDDLEHIEPQILQEPTRTTIRVDSLHAFPDKAGLHDNACLAQLVFEIVHRGKTVNVVTVPTVTQWTLKHLPNGQASLTALLNECKEAQDSTSANSTSNTAFAMSSGDRNTVREMQLEIAGATTEREKVRILYSFMQKKLRYVAEYDSLQYFWPHPPAHVLQMMYGDCKDLANLLHSLGKEYGLDIKLALMHTDYLPDTPWIQPDFFNHMICVWVHGDSTTFLDPTDNYTSFGAVSSLEYGKRCLVLDGTGYYLSVPNITSQPLIDVHIDATGSVLDSCSVDVSLRGAYREAALYSYANDDTYTANSTVPRILSNLGTKIPFSHLVRGEDEHGTLHLRGMADMSKWVAVSRQARYFPKAPFTMVSAAYYDRRNDSYSAAIDWAASYHLTIDYPRTATMVAACVEHYEKAGGHYDSEFDPDFDGHIRFNYSLYMPMGVFSGTDKADLMDFIGHYFALNKEMFALPKE